jgi:hypothetical protein
MSRPWHAYVDPAAQPAPPVPAAVGENQASPRFPLPSAAIAIFASIRLLALGVSAFLLPRGTFQTLHYSLWHLIASWDSASYLTIAARGYSYVPGDLRHDVIFAWFPGYPAAIDTLSWIPGVGADRAALTVTVAAGLAAAWGLARLGLALTGDRRISLLMVALWGVAPGSLVWTMLYSEALFCALAVWSLAALVERRWLTAAALTILAGTVRSTAIALVAAVAVAALPPVIRAVRAREPVGAPRRQPPRPAAWRPAVALLAAPLGLLGYWGYSAWATHHLAGFLWVEKNAHNSFDWGKGIILAAKSAIISGPTAPVALTLLVLAAAVTLTACSLTERIPVYLHVYTLVVVVLALAPGPYYLGSKPLFLLPAMLLGLPLARLLARVRGWVLIPLFAVLAAASTWFGIYLMTIGWAP